MLKTRFGHCIYKAESNLFVYQNPLYRWLTFGSCAIQTIINRRNPARIALNYIPAMTLTTGLYPGDCCLLGLGGAGVAHALSPHLKNYTLTAIESSELVIDIANHYFMAEKIPNLNVIHQDASQFVKKSTRLFQHIFVDLFDSHAFPSSCNNEAFFAHCKTLLKPEGILAVNIANIEEQKPILQFIKNVFSFSWILLPVPKTSNVIILAYHQESIMPLLTQLKQHRMLKQLIWDEQYGYVASPAVARGFV